MILTPQIKKSPYSGQPPLTPSRSVGSLPRICSQNISVFLEIRCHPPSFEDLSYATVLLELESKRKQCIHNLRMYYVLSIIVALKRALDPCRK